jgi:hypothetical protein
MKHFLFFTFLFIIVVFSTSFAQRTSPELLNIINRLPSNQRSLVVNEYERFRAGTSTGSTSFGGNRNQGDLLSTPAIIDESVAIEEPPIDSLESARSTKLKLLTELESMIRVDISANDLELDATKNEADSISPEKGSIILLDRKYDLEI